jgi:hypothetical protein
VYVDIAFAGVFPGDRANRPDFVTPYLSTVLGFAPTANDNRVSSQGAFQ